MIFRLLAGFLAKTAQHLRPGRQVPELSDQEWERLCTDAADLSWLSGARKERLRLYCRDFLASRQVVGSGRCSQTLAGPQGPLLRWTLALHCCLPVLELGLGAYRNWHSIILVPASRRLREVRDEGNGMMTEYEEDTAGEVLPWGPVIISVEDMLQSRRGYNVVIHEMAHKLDLGNGELDACPDLPGNLRARWTAEWVAAWEDFSALAAHSGKRRKLPLDEYAATDPQEFFAVVMEEFFGRPWHVLRVYPGLYRLMASWLGLDPAGAMKAP